MKQIVREYDIGRIQSFNDAVIAIAITLLVLDIHPQLGITAGASETWQAVADVLPNIGAFALSFWVIYAFWGANRIYRTLQTADSAIMRLNAGLLFIIALLPFPTALMWRPQTIH